MSEVVPFAAAREALLARLTEQLPPSSEWAGRLMLMPEGRRVEPMPAADAVEEAPEAAILDSPPKRAAPRIPFGWVVERGLLRPGSTLFDHRRRVAARVRADGTLIGSGPRGDHRGSIHQVGAAMAGLPACNGWTFWHYEEGEDLRPIDVLRERIRSEMH